MPNPMMPRRRMDGGYGSQGAQPPDGMAPPQPGGDPNRRRLAQPPQMMAGLPDPIGATLQGNQSQVGSGQMAPGQLDPFLQAGDPEQMSAGWGQMPGQQGLLQGIVRRRLGSGA